MRRRIAAIIHGVIIMTLVAIIWLIDLEIYLRKPVPGLSDDGRLPDIAF